MHRSRRPSTSRVRVPVVVRHWIGGRQTSSSLPLVSRSCRRETACAYQLAAREGQCVGTDHEGPRQISCYRGRFNYRGTTWLLRLPPEGWCGTPSVGDSVRPPIRSPEEPCSRTSSPARNSTSRRHLITGPASRFLKKSTARRARPPSPRRSPPLSRDRLGRGSARRFESGSRRRLGHPGLVAVDPGGLRQIERG